MVSIAVLQNSFVKYLPVIRRYARFAFRNLDLEKREESISNTVALAWKAWHRLNERDRANEPGILKAVAWYSIRQTKAGRRIDSAGKPRDPLALRCYGKANFEPFDLNELVGKNTSVSDAVSFRVDVPEFLRTLNDRQRNIALDLAAGMTTTDAAAKYGVTPGRISQFRREFKTMFDRHFAE